MKIISPIIICVILLLIAGCSDSITATDPSIEPPTTIANSESDSTEEAVSTDPPLSTPELGNIKEDKYYSIKYKQSLVQLRDDEKTVVHILGSLTKLLKLSSSVMEQIPLVVCILSISIIVD